MSLINGDKARDHRRHKKLVKMREKRAALKAQLKGGAHGREKSKSRGQVTGSKGEGKA